MEKYIENKKNKISIPTNHIVFKIFDKTFPKSNGIYGLKRFQETDKLEMIRKNHHGIINYFNADHLLIMRHVHGNEVVDADLIKDFSIEPEADAAVTSKNNIILSVQSADCVPVLLGSNNGEVIGAAHCGWRGAKADVLLHTQTIMKKKGADTVFAIIGPAIHQENYEVGQEFYDEIVALEPKSYELFKKSQHSQKWLFNLPEFVKFKLKKIDISNIIDLCEDTYSNPDKYYSYRRDVHLGTGDARRNILSTIMISNNDNR